MLQKVALDHIEKGIDNAEDIHHIMQGHRNKFQADIYIKTKRSVIERKDLLIGEKQEGKEKEWADKLVNIMFSLASNKPNKKGTFKNFDKDDIEELLTHYEHEFCDAAQYLDSEGITRLAQVMYLFKSVKFENIWWRIENRVHELIEVPNSFDTYNISTILRSFSKCQENRMAGSNKLFIHFEPTVLK